MQGLSNYPYSLKLWPANGLIHLHTPKTVATIYIIIGSTMDYNEMKMRSKDHFLLHNLVAPKGAVGLSAAGIQFTWLSSRSSSAGEQPGCWAAHLPGRW